MRGIWFAEEGSVSSVDFVSQSVVSANREIVLGIYDRLMESKRSLGLREANRNHGSGFCAAEEYGSLRQFLQFYRSIAAALPDYQLQIDDIAGKGELVMVRYTVSGTQTGALLGTAPTNARVTISGIDVFRLSRGKIIEYWDTARQINSLAVAQN
jgi:predicted ester cyclase